VTFRELLRDQLHSNGHDVLKVTMTVLVPVTIQVPHSQLSFQSKEGLHSATMNVFGQREHF